MSENLVSSSFPPLLSLSLPVVHPIKTFSFPTAQAIKDTVPS